MLLHYLATLYMSIHLSSACAHTLSKYNEELPLNLLLLGSFHENVDEVSSNRKFLDSHVHYSASSQIRNGEATSDFKSFGGHNLWHHHRYHLRRVHGLLSFAGWGILLPIGVIISRYFRGHPMKCQNWLNAHILCQSMGYILGTIGWGTALWLGSTCKSCISKTYKILGALVFSLTSIQMLALFLQPKKEDDEYGKRWKICHNVLGYVLITIAIAYTLEGIDHQRQAAVWKWSYVGFLVAIGFIVIAFETCKCVKARSN